MLCKVFIAHVKESQCKLEAGVWVGLPTQGSRPLRMNLS